MKGILAYTLKTKLYLAQELKISETEDLKKINLLYRVDRLELRRSYKVPLLMASKEIDIKSDFILLILCRLSGKCQLM